MSFFLVCDIDRVVMVRKIMIALISILSLTKLAGTSLGPTQMLFRSFGTPSR